MLNEYRIEGNFIHIKLNRNYEAIIDREEYPKISAFKWSAYQSGGQTTPYVLSNVKSETGMTMIYLHRLILGAPKGMCVDHINHNGLDNRRCNLRLCSHKENLENRSGANVNSSTGMRGVYIHKTVDRTGNTKGLVRTYYNVRVMSNGKSKTKNFPYTEHGLKQAQETIEEMRRSIMTHA
jgi:hypothetical protein